MPKELVLAAGPGGEGALLPSGGQLAETQGVIQGAGSPLPVSETAAFKLMTFHGFWNKASWSSPWGLGPCCSISSECSLSRVQVAASFSFFSLQANVTSPGKPSLMTLSELAPKPTPCPSLSHYLVSLCSSTYWLFANICVHSVSVACLPHQSVWSRRTRAL